MNSSGVVSCLCFDRETGLFMDFSWLGSGAFCYSNQQTDWALELGRELLRNSGPILHYLLGDGDLPNLTMPCENMIKSSNVFIGMGALFILEDAEIITSLTSIGSAIGEGVVLGSLVVPITFVSVVLIFSIEPVGSQNEYEELMAFYSVHNSSNMGEPSINNELVQIRGYDEKRDYYKNSRNTVDFSRSVPNSPGIPLAFYISNTGPDDENTSFIVKVTAGALISMLILPGGLFAASGIGDNINLTFEYDKEKEEYTISFLNYEWGVPNV